MKPTREEVIRVARECGLYVGDNLSRVKLVGGSYNMNCDLLIHLNIEDMERFAQHFYEAGLREFQDQAWKLIDAIEEVRGARTRGEEDWKALNKADAALRRELQQATGEKT